MLSNAFLPQHFHLTAALLSSMLQLFFFLQDTHCQVGEGSVVLFGVFFFLLSFQFISRKKRFHLPFRQKTKRKKRKEGREMHWGCWRGAPVRWYRVLLAGAGPASSRASFWGVEMLAGTVSPSPRSRVAEGCTAAKGPWEQGGFGVLCSGVSKDREKHILRKLKY